MSFSVMAWMGEASAAVTAGSSANRIRATVSVDVRCQTGDQRQRDLAGGEIVCWPTAAGASRGKNMAREMRGRVVVCRGIGYIGLHAFFPRWLENNLDGRSAQDRRGATPGRSCYLRTRCAS